LGHALHAGFYVSVNQLLKEGRSHGASTLHAPGAPGADVIAQEQRQQISQSPIPGHD
jgi:hypothetical protein